MAFADGDALVVGVVDGVAEPLKQSHEGRAVRGRVGIVVEVAGHDGRVVEDGRDVECYRHGGFVDGGLVGHFTERVIGGG